MAHIIKEIGNKTILMELENFHMLKVINIKANSLVIEPKEREIFLG